MEHAAVVSWEEVMEIGGRMVAEGPPPLGEECRGFTLLHGTGVEGGEAS